MSDKETYDSIFRSLFGDSQKFEEMVFSDTGVWDSITHMKLMSRIEEEFKIRMETDDILDFSSYIVGIGILRGYGVNIEDNRCD